MDHCANEHRKNVMRVVLELNVRLLKCDSPLGTMDGDSHVFPDDRGRPR